MAMTLTERRSMADRRIERLMRQGARATADGEHELAAEIDAQVAGWDAWGHGIPEGGDD